jgi:hypothetical protein
VNTTEAAEMRFLKTVLGYKRTAHTRDGPTVSQNNCQSAGSRVDNRTSQLRHLKRILRKVADYKRTPRQKPNTPKRNAGLADDFSSQRIPSTVWRERMEAENEEVDHIKIEKKNYDLSLEVKTV